jgi:hypothetical protein
MPYSQEVPWFVRREAAQPMVHNGGMLPGSGLGRADDLPVNVPSGSYVVPSHILSGLGEGSSLAGAKILGSFFGIGSGPLGMPAPHIHGGFGGPRNIRMNVAKLPRGSSTGSILTATKTPGFQQGGTPSHTPIMASSSEFTIPPEIVIRIGKGSLTRGHDVLDELMKLLAKENIATLKALPGPVKR